MIEIFYPYPIAGVTDLQARLTLAGAAVTGADWQIGTAAAIRGTHAGYNFNFADVVADSVEIFSASQNFATEILLRPLVDLGDLPAKVEEIRAKVLSFGAGRIIIQSPLLKDGTLLLVAGDDYYRREGRAPYFDIMGTGVAAWSIGSIAFIVEDATLSATMTYEAITGGIRAWLELSSPDTSKLANLETATFAIKVQLVGGRTITSVKGKLIVENPTV